MPGTVAHVSLYGLGTQHRAGTKCVLSSCWREEQEEEEGERKRQGEGRTEKQETGMLRSDPYTWTQDRQIGG